MSHNRRYNNTADDLGALAILALLGIGYLAVKKFRTPLHEQLIKLDRPSVWGEVIEGISCPHCQILNERGMIDCFFCGAPLVRQIVQAPKPSNSTSTTILKVILILCVSYAIVAGACAFFLSIIILVDPSTKGTLQPIVDLILGN